MRPAADRLLILHQMNLLCQCPQHGILQPYGAAPSFLGEGP